MTRAEVFKVHVNLQVLFLQEGQESLVPVVVVLSPDISFKQRLLTDPAPTVLSPLTGARR